MSATGIIKSKPDGSFVEVLPDGTERPYSGQETDWEALDAMTEAELHEAALSDPDNPPLTEEQLARMRRRGRPPKTVKKVPTTVRLDADVLAYFRRGGRHWQTRINAALRKAAGL
jgi:uncharacterized protein (DUF4415 family)